MSSSLPTMEVSQPDSNMAPSQAGAGWVIEYTPAGLPPPHVGLENRVSTFTVSSWVFLKDVPVQKQQNGARLIRVVETAQY